MSDLKFYVMPSEPNILGQLLGQTIVGQTYYLKSEADEVIAKKDAKILALDSEVFKQKHHAELFLDERNYAETQLRHYKSEADKLLYCLKSLVMSDLIKDSPEKTSAIEIIKAYDNGNDKEN